MVLFLGNMAMEFALGFFQDFFLGCCDRFSHIICKKTEKQIPNYKTIYKIDELEIRRVINPPKQYKIINTDTVNKLQPEVDRIYEPLL